MNEEYEQDDDVVVEGELSVTIDLGSPPDDEGEGHTHEVTGRV